MAVSNYTLANLITDVYYRRYGRNASEASVDERAVIIRFAEFNAREFWKVFHWFFAVATDDTLTVTALNKVVLPSDCETPLRLTNGNGVEISYTQYDTIPAELTILDTGFEGEDVTLEYRTNEPTYVIGTETTEIHTCLYPGILIAVVGELWGSDHQSGKRDYWMSEAKKAILRAIDNYDRQRGTKRRAHVRTYSRGR